MAVAVDSRLEISQKQYRSIMEALGLERTPSEALAHLAYFGDDGLRVVDIWRSQADWQQFLEERLIPTLKRLDIKVTPVTEIHNIHNIYTPRGDELAREGRSPHPA